MATIRFNSWVVEVARRLQEPKAADALYLSAGVAADRYSALLVAGYVNSAIRDLVRSELAQYGPLFADRMPEMIRVNGPLALNAGALLKPVDLLYVISVVDDAASPNTKQFRPVAGWDIGSAVAGSDVVLVGTATEPLFYDEGSYIRTLGVVAGNVYVRYVINHQDIVISEAAAGNGKWYTGADGAFTLATKRLTGTFNAVLAAGDVGKNVMFRTAAKVYHARISGFVAAGPPSTVTIDGTDLPAADIAAGDVVQILVSDVSPETSDLQMKEHYRGDVIERAVQKGILDAKRGLLPG